MSNDDSGLNSAVADAAAGVENQTQEVNPQSGENGNSGGINPAWNDLLGTLPTSLHSQVTPHLQKWDQGVQQRFATVQSQFEPYKALIDQQVNPDEITASLRLAKMISENPRDFYDRMGQYYASEWGINGDQGQAPNDADEYSLEGFDEEEEGADLSENPLVKQLQEQQQVLAQYLAADLQQKQQAEQAKIDAEADNEVRQGIESITAKYGNGNALPEPFIQATLSMAVQNNKTIEEAAEIVAQLAGMNASAPAPKVMSPSGGMPLNQVNPASLDTKATKNLVMEILRSRSEQG